MAKEIQGLYDRLLPAPCLHEDGSVLLIYKARQYEGNTHGQMTIGAAWASRFDGRYRVLNDKPIFPPSKFHLEDPFIWRTGSGYALIAKDMEGNLCGEKHAGIQALSEDGLNWQLAQRPKAYSRTILWDDGSTTVMGSFERPFLLFQDGKPTHLFAATADGSGGFAHAQNTWNMVIPISD